MNDEFAALGCRFNTSEQKLAFDFVDVVRRLSQASGEVTLADDRFGVQVQVQVQVKARRMRAFTLVTLPRAPDLRHAQSERGLFVFYKKRSTAS